tara:strand:+ start:15748 stop:16113 length:366 start_codon:yes stop_codon:yes gene_type:complete
MNNDEKEILDEKLVRLRQLSKNLDESFTIPGTKIKFGMDALLGIIPGGGDIVSGVFSLYMLRAAIKMKLPKRAILSMFLNIILDTAVGIIPVAGDIFDVFWKSNKMNLKIIEKHLEKRLKS